MIHEGPFSKTNLLKQFDQQQLTIKYIPTEPWK